MAPRNSRKAGKDRRYVWPPEPPHELDVPSVTTILGGGLPKPALVGWAARGAAKWAVAHKAGWENLPSDAAIDLIRKAPSRERDRKADVGTITHASIEKYAGGTDADALLADMHDDDVGYLYAALAFFDTFEPQILLSEATVYSRAYQYAGTFDLLCNLGSKKTLVDFKTSKDIYPENGAQLAAYAYGNFVARGDQEDTESLKGIVQGLGVCLRPDGTFKAVPFPHLRERFDLFLAAKTVYDLNKKFRMEKALIP